MPVYNSGAGRRNAANDTLPNEKRYPAQITNTNQHRETELQCALSGGERAGNPGPLDGEVPDQRSRHRDRDEPQSGKLGKDRETGASAERGTMEQGRLVEPDQGGEERSAGERDK